MTIETANKLLKLRKEHNLSQEELAEKLGISRQAVSKWERAEASPDTDNLILLAKLYKVSLDELLNIDIKLYDKDTIKLTKPTEEYEESSQDGEVYSSNYIPPIQEEFNPNSYAPPVQEEFNPNSYISSIPEPIYQNTTTVNTNIPISTPSFLQNIANIFETFMFKHNISYKWLYLFPYYAIAIALFFLFGYVIGFGLSWGWFLTIPLYYTTIKCIEKKNPYIFCYPVVALILFFMQGYLFGFALSWLWFLTIPLYYTMIPAIKKNNPLIFCYPVVAVMFFLFFGYFISYKLSMIFFATIPFYYWYFSKRA